MMLIIIRNNEIMDTIEKSVVVNVAVHATIKSATQILL